jgi:hypothetical protein
MGQETINYVKILREEIKYIGNLIFISLFVNFILILLSIIVTLWFGVTSSSLYLLLTLIFAGNIYTIIKLYFSRQKIIDFTVYYVTKRALKK